MGGGGENTYQQEGNIFRKNMRVEGKRQDDVMSVKGTREEHVFL